MSDTIPTFRLRLLPANELSGRLTKLKMSEREFCKLTGVPPRTLFRWLDNGGAPAWVRAFLIMAEFDGATDAAHEAAESNRMTEEAFREHRDSFPS